MDDIGAHQDWQSAVRQLAREISNKADDGEVDRLRTDLQMASEGFQRVWAILDDLIDDEERAEYADDLDRLHQIASLLL